MQTSKTYKLNLQAPEWVDDFMDQLELSSNRRYELTAIETYAGLVSRYEMYNGRLEYFVFKSKEDFEKFYFYQAWDHYTNDPLLWKKYLYKYTKLKPHLKNLNVKLPFYGKNYSVLDLYKPICQKLNKDRISIHEIFIINYEKAAKKTWRKKLEESNHYRMSEVFEFDNTMGYAYGIPFPSRLLNNYQRNSETPNNLI